MTLNRSTPTPGARRIPWPSRDVHLLTLLMLLSTFVPMLLHAACVPEAERGTLELRAALATDVPLDARGHVQLRSLGSGERSLIPFAALHAGTRRELPAGLYTVDWATSDVQDVRDVASAAPARVVSILPGQVTPLRVRPMAPSEALSLRH